MSINLLTQYITTICCHDGCHISFAMPNELYNQRLKDKKEFYCPNGHSQHFIDENEEQKLKREIDRLNNKIECIKDCKKRLEYSCRHWKGEVTKLKKQKGK